MKTGEKLYGFSVISSEYIPEAEGTLWLLNHEKFNTPLCFLERKDSNKSFYIAFPTIPSDDTGVFHILEHSVLCGSKKFPVKEPFVELLKSSLKTFLNAMTYPDRTVYPISSRSDKDFYNLINVYMDAVFHPLATENESIFMQEGHRYEFSEDKESLCVNGVVYNEMKGAMSSPDEISSQELLTMLYPNNVYGKNSGGDPDSIYDLTYADFCAAHKKHYHPSNALIFLDGEVDLDSVLPLIGSYLDEFDTEGERVRVGEDCEICASEKTVEYEISDEESAESKTRIYLGVRTFDFSDTKSALLLSIIADALTGTNDSPLTKAFLDEEICEDVSMFTLADSAKFGSYAIELKNVAVPVGEAYAFLYETLERLVKDGIGKERLLASLNSKEFKVREKDFGSTPKGLIFGLAMLDSWLYADDPAGGLKYESDFAEIRKLIETDAPERMLEDLFINNEKTAKLTLAPSKTLGRERAEKERLCLEKIKREMSDGELAALADKNNAFMAWQSTPDKEEDLATLPKLTVSDIPESTDWTPTEVVYSDGCEVLLHDIPTGGISYVELLFDISDLDEAELSLASHLAFLLGKCRTAKHSADELSQMKKLHLGMLGVSTTVFAKKFTPTPYFFVTASSLDSERDKLVELVGEILNETVFDEHRTIKHALTQRLNARYDSFISSGHAAAIRRARAYVSSMGAVAEYLLGFELYKDLKKTVNDFDEKCATLTDELSRLLKKIVTKSRLTVALTGNPCEDFIQKLCRIPDLTGEKPIPKIYAPLGCLNEGIVIPSRVSYASKSAGYEKLGEQFVGSMHVVSNILSYTHLWNAIRVKGGAYGAGFSVRQSGDVSTYSYRDPDPRASIETYRKSGEFLRAFANEEECLDSYIIGTFSDYDSLNSARSAGMEATNFYMMGISKADEEKTRKEMLSFDKAELLRLADLVDELMLGDAVCVVGPAEQIDSCMDVLKTKIEL